MTTCSLSEKLSDLLAAGLTDKEIAERANCAASTVHRIRNGVISDPRYSVGSVIDSMHALLRKKKPHKRSAA